MTVVVAGQGGGPRRQPGPLCRHQRQQHPLGHPGRRSHGRIRGWTVLHLCRASRVVGSRAGAVFRRPGLAVAPRFLWECLISPAVNPSPTPATSNGAGGFPALRFPARFAPKLMRPILLAALSAGGTPGNRRIAPDAHTANAYSTCPNRSPFAPGHASSVAAPSSPPSP